jgi:hypothetical protein
MASLYFVLILVPYWLCQATLLPNLAGDILLTRLESPYDASGDMLIPFGSTVTIESGTVLRFPRGAQLTVRGTLLAKVNIDLPSRINADLYHRRAHLIDVSSLRVQQVHSIMINSRCIAHPARTSDFVSSMVQVSRVAFCRCISRIAGVMCAPNSFGKSERCVSLRFSFDLSLMNRWFDYDATLTCRMMGFRNGSVVPYRINGSEPPWYGLVIDHPACRSNIDGHLLDCPGVRAPPQLGLHMCGK